MVYARPDYIDTLATSTPASAHVTVDYELRGCPIDRGQLLDTLAALLVGRKAETARGHGMHRMQALRCQLRDGRRGIACLGPVTHAGCGALCPRHHRGCYGCFGPMATPNTGAMIPLLHRDGMSGGEVERVFDTFNVTQFHSERVHNERLHDERGGER